MKTLSTQKVTQDMDLHARGTACFDALTKSVENLNA